MRRPRVARGHRTELVGEPRGRTSGPAQRPDDLTAYALVRVVQQRAHQRQQQRRGRTPGLAAYRHSPHARTADLRRRRREHLPQQGGGESVIRLDQQVVGPVGVTLPGVLDLGVVHGADHGGRRAVRPRFAVPRQGQGGGDPLHRRSVHDGAGEILDGPRRIEETERERE